MVIHLNSHKQNHIDDTCLLSYLFTQLLEILPLFQLSR